MWEKNHDEDGSVPELDVCRLGSPEIFCATDKVEKQWGVEDKLVEEFYNNVAE
jgi:hypothetical protein